MTDETQITEAPVATIDAEKKAIENDIHPAVRTLWDEFEGDLDSVTAFFKAEWEKLAAKI